MSISISKYRYGKVTVVMLIMMLLSIPAVIIFHPFVAASGYNVLIKSDKIVEKSSIWDSNNKYKVHIVKFEYSKHPDEERYYSTVHEYAMDSKDAMSRYKLLKSDKIYSDIIIWRIMVYATLWIYIIIASIACSSEIWGDKIYYFEKLELIEIYYNKAVKFLKFCGYDEVKLKACHGYILDIFNLRTYSNPSKFEIIKAIKRKILEEENLNK